MRGELSVAAAPDLARWNLAGQVLPQLGLLWIVNSLEEQRLILPAVMLH